tara:strand:- start:221 stop:781 length:561 start_codon:yes stop_codon:yes gene_type:complete
MAALLCRTIKTYVEPPSLQHVIAGSCVEPQYTHHNLADKVRGQKVFLYRQLPSQIGAWMQEMVVYDLTEQAEKWVKSIEFMRAAKNLIFIESNDFFSDVRSTMDLVCNHFKIPKIENLGWANHNIKNLGLQDIKHAPIILPEPPDYIGDFTAKDGIIDSDLAMTIPQISCIVDKLREKYPHLTEYM